MPRTNFRYIIMYYFYVIKNESDKLYHGYSSNLRKRLFEHNKGINFSTKKHVWKLIYYEAYFSQEDAKERERQIKQFGQAWAQLRRRIKKSLNES